MVRIASVTAAFCKPFADLLKFILKEDIVPDKSTRFIYFLAPVIATMAALMTMIVYPFGPDTRIPFINITIPLSIARFDIGLLYVLGITSIGVYGIMLAGWSSNNKYSLMGGLRSSAQMISYELALGLESDRRHSARRHAGSGADRRTAIGLARDALVHLLSAARVSSST